MKPNYIEMCSAKRSSGMGVSRLELEERVMEVATPVCHAAFKGSLSSEWMSTLSVSASVL